MTKLLDFPAQERANTKKQKEIQQYVDEDALYGFTPDMPHLRYKGPQMVFLWDEMKSYEAMRELDLVGAYDFEIASFTAYTANHYIPFENNLTSDKGFKHYMFRTVNWPDQVEDDQLEGFTVKALPVAGRLFKCSLEAIAALDGHYCNGHVFQRSKMTIRKSASENSETTVVWAYSNRLSSICKYDPHENKYDFGTHIRPKNVPIWKPATAPMFETYMVETNASKQAVGLLH